MNDTAIPPNWSDLLHQHGHRVTEQRRTVLQIVWSLRHVTPDQVREAAKARGVPLDLSTAYRTLELLDEVGLITHAHLGHGSPTYHPVDEHPHVHLVCRTCDVVSSVAADSVISMCAQVLDETGFEVDAAHLALHGTCRRCSVQSTARPGPENTVEAGNGGKKQSPARR